MSASDSAPDAPHSRGEDSLVDGLVDLLRDLERRERTAILEAEAGLARERAEEASNWVDDPDRGARLYDLLSRGSALDGPERIAALMERLREGGARPERFVDTGLLGSGGMGQVRAARDVFLRRDVALKSVHVAALLGRRAREVWMQRFVDEAQITAQLEHPSIPPVYDIGVEPDGRAFFTMQRVRGHGLDAVIQAYYTDRELGGACWTLERIVEIVRRVGEAVAYAHSRGVLHRDLKPENVMVGEYGAVYVVDWGLARTFERLDEEEWEAEAVETERDVHPETAMGTRAGAVLGTLQYMAPEQASPGGKASGPLVDVYAIGAILYRALAGHAPYGKTRGATSQEELLDRLRGGPPTPIDELAPHTPAALRAILKRAMEREPERRYGSVAELTDDLSAYLERRVVRAHRTGRLVATAKWVERNRRLAGVAAAGLLLALVGFAGWRVNAARVARAEGALAANERTRVLLELPAEAELLAAEARALLPLDPARRPALEALAARAEALITTPLAAGLVAELRAELERSGTGAALPAARREAIERRIGEIERTIDTVGPMVETAGRPRLEQLEDELEQSAEGPVGASARERSVARVVEAYAALELGTRGDDVPLAALDRPTIGTQLALLEHLETEQNAPGSRAAWDAARILLADPDGVYGGRLAALREDPRLLPLGPDPRTGLLEFAHLATGEVPVRDGEGRLVIEPESAVVLVLVPGADTVLGAVADGPGNLDPQAGPNEGPCHLVRLDPFLIGKHELTQGQFERLAGDNPSAFAAGRAELPNGLSIDGRHPVESVRWVEARRVLAAVGLGLPTSSQWEYAARAATTTPWCSGDDDAGLVDHANLLDRAALALENHPPDWAPLAEAAERFDDPWPVHAPVGSFEPNAFGLHDVHGNVFELCEDAPHPLDGSDAAWLFHGTGGRGWLGEIEPDPAGFHQARGGSFASTPLEARIGFRSTFAGDYARENIGLRAVMGVALGDD